MFTNEFPPTPAMQQVRPRRRDDESRHSSPASLQHSMDTPSALRQIFGVASRMKPRKALAFLLRAGLSPRSTSEWLKFLNDFSAQHTLAPPHDELFRKNLFSFLVYRMPRRTRLNILTQHFDLTRHLLCPQMLRTLWTGGMVELGTVCGRDQQYCLQLRLSDHCGARHEGAFTLSLIRTDDQVLLCKASFVFVRHSVDSYSLVIGGLQGGAHADAKRAVISATRDLGGLRPKDAVMLALKGLMVRSTRAYMMAVSNSSHVINHRASKRRNKLPDMDTYWRERGGVPLPPFGFQIPVDPMLHDGNASRRSNAKTAFWTIGTSLIVRTDP